MKKLPVSLLSNWVELTEEDKINLYEPSLKVLGNIFDNISTLYNKAALELGVQDLSINARLFNILPQKENPYWHAFKDTSVSDLLQEVLEVKNSLLRHDFSNCDHPDLSQTNNIKEEFEQVLNHALEVVLILKNCKSALNALNAASYDAFLAFHNLMAERYLKLTTHDFVKTYTAPPAHVNNPELWEKTIECKSLVMQIYCQSQQLRKMQKMLASGDIPFFENDYTNSFLLKLGRHIPIVVNDSSDGKSKFAFQDCDTGFDLIKSKCTPTSGFFLTSSQEYVKVHGFEISINENKFIALCSTQSEFQAELKNLDDFLNGVKQEMVKAAEDKANAKYCNEVKLTKVS